KNEQGVDEIGRVNTDNASSVYTPIIRTNLFNFQLNCPIEGIFYYNYKNDLIISWCDGVYDNSNSPKILNCNTLPLTLNPDYTLTDVREFEKIKMFPNVSVSAMEIVNRD